MTRDISLMVAALSWLCLPIFGQQTYSLDSIHYYFADSSLESPVSKTIVIEKDELGRPRIDQQFQYDSSSGTFLIEAIHSYRYHANVASTISCWPEYDTCILQNIINWNEFGETVRDRHHTF
ncbi:MAG: hypothetical protein R2824_22315 [Saprospiraceae bacterium]|nr:hypothetical protein [Lewinella sp.]